MEEFISNLATTVAAALNSNPLVVFLLSMLPIVEVRGGIPIGLELNMSAGDSFGYAILASFVVCPIILFLLKAVIRWMCKSKIFGSFGKALDGYFYEKAKKVESGKIVNKKSNIFLKYLALYAFVAAPLPLTGYWTGSAVAVFMNLNPFVSYFVIMLGNLTAGGLILAMSLLLGDKAYIITVIFIIFIPIVLGILIYKLVKKKKGKNQAKEGATEVLDSTSSEDNSLKNATTTAVEVEDESTINNDNTDSVIAENKQDYISNENTGKGDNSAE